MSREAMIELDQLCRSFGALRAVDAISFTVAAGEVLGYIGPNGAGKTTSMRILATLDVPTSGEAYVDGFSVLDDPDRVRRRLGFMPDSYGTYPNMNSWEYLDFFARAYGLRGAERQRALRYTIGFLHMESLVFKPIRTLSKGMKQRLCLGRAMIHDPAVLILDEPAAGLDPRARIELRGMIRELAANGKTILVSSHIWTELAEMCDRVAIVDQGRLLTQGTVSEIHQQQETQYATRRETVLRLLENSTRIADWLQARPDLEVRDLVIEGDTVRFTHAGDRAKEAQLLRDLIQADFAITDFGSRVKTLEDIFMQVTGQGTIGVDP